MKIIKGDLLKLAEEGHFDIIIHGANCFCKMKSGIAGQIAKQYPGAARVDSLTLKGDYNKLGNCSVYYGPKFVIVNAYTQFDTNNYKEPMWMDKFEYEAFALILKKLFQEFVALNSFSSIKPVSFGLPLIGCHLAGGDETRIRKIIQDFADKAESSGLATVTLVEYDQ